MLLLRRCRRLASFIVVTFLAPICQGAATGSSSNALSSVSISSHAFVSLRERSTAVQSSGQMSGHRMSAALHSSSMYLFNSSGGFHQRRKFKTRNAIVTHICGNDWVPGALALAGSLRRFPLQTDLVIMVGENLTNPYKELLASMFDRVYVEAPIAPHPSIKRNGADCVTLQLRSWQLPYQKVLYMDADMLALKSPEPLLSQYGEITAKIDRWRFGWNGGMFICEPNETTFSLLASSLKTYKGGEKKGIQQYLNHMFPKCNASDPSPPKSRGRAGCWGGVLKKTHNKFTRELTLAELDSLTKQHGESSEYSSVHFSGDWGESVKPWMAGCMALRDSTTKNQETRKAVLNLWMRSFREFKPPPGMGNLARVDCPLFTCAQERRKLDYVVLAEHLDCTLRSVIKSLKDFASPRKILVITSGQDCTQAAKPVHSLGWFHSLGELVQCVDEDTVLPEVTRLKIEDWIHGRFGSKRGHPLRERAGWYLQQFVKMGIADVASKYDLSEDYVVWDSGMVLLRDFCPFNPQGQANLMESDDEPDSSCHKNYRNSFMQLAGFDYALSERSNKTFTSHHMVVNRSAMTGFLKHIVRAKPNAAHWSLSILEAACPTVEACFCGFSELGSYASWMKKSYPESVAEVAQQWAHPVKPKPHDVRSHPLCCPAGGHDLDQYRSQGSLAVAFSRHRDCDERGEQEQAHPARLMRPADAPTTTRRMRWADWP